MLLEVENLTAGYHEMQVVEGVSLGVDEGEGVTVVGPNGSGKTTLLRAIVGIISEYHGRIMGGEVWFRGERLNGSKPHVLIKKGLAFVPDGGKVFPSMSVRENLEMGGFTLSDKGEVKERVEFVLGLFPILRELVARRAAVLSGGERQILSLARTMMLRPKMLILDEPSAGLSPNYVKVLFEKLREIAGEGVGVLIVEQNAHAALKYSDRGYVLRHGKIVTSAPASELLKQEDVFKLL